MLLIAAAGLKAWPLVTGQAVESQAASLGKLILIQGEILLALWMISGISAAWAFRVGMVFFAGAACVNLRSIWLGEVSCGCFGKVEVPPWVSLGINAVAIAAMVILRPRFEGGVIASTVSSVKSMGWVALASVLILAIGGGGALTRSYFQPRVIEVSKEIDLGVMEVEARKEVAISLRNVSDNPVTILGARTNCTCSLVKGLPVVIEAGGLVEVVLSIVPPARSQFEGHVFLYTSNRNAATIHCRYFARINGAPKVLNNQ